MTSRKILLIDDDDEFRRGLASDLAARGFLLVEASDGSEGLVLFGKEEFDVVVTDFNMPQVGGFAVAYRIRQLRPQCPVIVVSSSNRVAGMLPPYSRLRVLQKPFAIDDLVGVVMELLMVLPVQ